MSKVRSGFGHRTVLHLEPSRAASTIGYALMVLFMAAVVVGASTVRTGAWARSIRDSGFDPSDEALLGVAGVAGALAAACLMAAIVNGRRWQIARRVLRASEDPELVGLIPSHDTSVSATRPTSIPQLDVRFVRPRKLRKPIERLRRVTRDSNIIGHRPVRIAYLRLFDNQPRMRTFIESAWREFGYVHVLRSATAVTRDEYRTARRTGSIVSLFLTSDEQFERVLAQQPDEPLPKGRHTFKNIAPCRIRVRDRYGSYPVRAMLCHGTYWKRAVDVLLARVDLVVVDLSGFSERNAGTAHELQRVIDRVPIEHVAILCDQRSRKRFLESQIQLAWSNMDEHSPNSGPRHRFVVVAVTDQYRSSSSGQGAGGQQQVQVKLIAQRRPTRRLVAAAQYTAEQHAREHPPRSA